MNDERRLSEALKQVRIVGEKNPELADSVVTAKEAIKTLSEKVEERETDE